MLRHEERPNRGPEDGEPEWHPAKLAKAENVKDTSEDGVFADYGTVAHFNVTSHPTGRWTAQQIVEAFPYDTAPRYLLRDRDGIYSCYFANRVRGMGIEEVLIAPRSPWQNPFVERLIRSIRRECLDHILVISEAHLRRVLKEYFAYYYDSRPHQSLDGNAPRPREMEPSSRGQIVAEPQVGGLHHQYRRAA